MHTAKYVNLWRSNGCAQNVSIYRKTSALWQHLGSNFINCKTIDIPLHRWKTPKTELKSTNKTKLATNSRRRAAKPTMHPKCDMNRFGCMVWTNGNRYKHIYRKHVVFRPHVAVRSPTCTKLPRVPERFRRGRGYCAYGMQLTHSRPTSRTQSADRWGSANSCTQYRGIPTWLLQRPVARRTSSDHR